MLCGYSVSYCETNCKHWTPAAVDCYLIGCNCSKCNINKIYFSNSDFKCVMKSTVIELVRKLGTPDLEGEKNV